MEEYLRRILSPLRLPISPPRPVILSKGSVCLGYARQSARDIAPSERGCQLDAKCQLGEPVSGAASSPTLINDSAGMPSPLCKRQIILRLSGRLRFNTSYTRLRLPI